MKTVFSRGPSQRACAMMAQPKNSKTPPPEPPTTGGTACVEAVPSQDGKLLESQKPASNSFTDSGYTSLSTTPSENPLEIDRVNSLRGGPIPFSFSKKKKSFFPNKPTDQSTRDRFRAIQPPFETLLLDEMRGHQKPGTRYKPISIRLAMMGTFEDDAQPHIAIFCQPEQKRLIQAFVKKNIVVDICRPKDLSAPAFEVVVFGNAPRLRFSKSNIEVVTDARNLPATSRNTMCGIPISFQDPSGQRLNATFGGIIKVVTARGSIELFGMTAGHVLHEWNMVGVEDMPDARSPQNTHPTPRSPLGDDGESSIHDVTDIDETDEDDYSEWETDSVSSGSSEALVKDGGGLWDFQNTTVLGELIAVSKEDAVCTACQYYDWALFRPILYGTNLVPTNPRTQLMICHKRPGAIENRPIIVLSSQTDCKAGSILSEPGRILLGGEEFIDAFMISMSEEPGIRDGDSGSWVVDAAHFEVYGQLVASDMFGSGYVIPMTDILSSIKSQLGAQTVSFPSFADDLQARHIAEQGPSATGIDKNSENAKSVKPRRLGYFRSTSSKRTY
ncbi:hypothetical protein F4782DRAFT_320761 [Xylaria castorea]|nr:hypothetical protein F4782DRAFT_320761 [Xylaria castorea]